MRRNQHQTQKQNLKNNLKTEDGSGLVLSLMVLLVLSVLGSALGILTIRSHNLADITRDSSSAYYIAEAGANMAYEEVESYVLEAYEDSTIATAFFGKIEKPFGEENNKNTVVYQESFAPQNGDQPKATVNIKENANAEGSISDKKQFIIESTGDINGKKRTVQKKMDVDWIEKGGNLELAFPINTAIIFRNKLDMSSNSEVHGDIHHDGQGKSDLSGTAKHYPINSAGIIIDPTIDWQAYLDFITKFPKKKMTINANLTNPLEMNEDLYIPKIDLSSNNELIIDTQDRDAYLEVDVLELSSNSNLEIIGEGNLTIHVNKELKLSSNANFNDEGTIDQLKIHYAGDKDLEFSSNAKYKGLLFVEKANIKISSNFNVAGAIITGGDSVEISSNVDVNSFIVAPEAKVDMSSNSSVKGLIIADIIDMSSNTKVIYPNEGDFSLELTPNLETEFDINDLIYSAPAIEP